MASQNKPTVLYVGYPIRFAIAKWEKFRPRFNLVQYESRDKASFIRELQPGGKYSNIDGIVRPNALTPGFPNCPPLDAEIVAALPASCTVIAANNHGYDGMDTVAMERRGIWYCNAAGGASVTTADTALLLILGTFRLSTLAERMLRQTGYVDFVAVEKNIRGYCSDPRGHICGIIGLGDVGVEIAVRANAIGMDVHYYGRSRKSVEVEDRAGGATYHENLDSLYAIADCLVLACPLTPETYHMFNRTSFGKMKPGVRIVNVARGKCIDEDALVEALDSGVVHSAGLDVYHDE